QDRRDLLVEVIVEQLVDELHDLGRGLRRSFAEVLAQLATQRGTLENVKDDTGESEGPAEPAAPIRDEAVTRHGFNMQRVGRTNAMLRRIALERGTGTVGRRWARSSVERHEGA